MSDKIRLGKVKSDIQSSQSYNPKKDSLCILGETLVIEKHRWDCNWYYSFGYIGNRNLHCHSSIFTKELLWCDVKEVFETSIFKTDTQFWVFKDLLKQAYSLKNTAEVYQYGGHCTSLKGITDTIKNKQRAKWLNNDLKKILDTMWNYLIELSETE